MLNKLVLTLALTIATPALTWGYGDSAPYGYGGYQDYGRGGESVTQRLHRQDEENRQSRAARWVEREQIQRSMERGKEIEDRNRKMFGIPSSP